MKWIGIDEADQTMSFKFFGLRELKRQRLPIPRTYGLAAPKITAAGVRSHKRQIEQNLAAQLVPGRRYCVRSAKGDEDGHNESKAGQFVTVLNLQAAADIYQGIERVAASYGEGDHGASAKQDVIMVQEMIEPVYSGVLFSKNPVSGGNEILIEAVAGSGEQLVQRGVEPFRVKYKWKKLLFDTAQKPTIPPQQMIAFCRAAAKVERRLGFPIDVEWAYDGRNFVWLQVRPITTRGIYNVYKNEIAKNYLPGLIKPLVWEIDIAVVNQAWIDLLETIIGPTGIQPDQLAKPFFYQAYFNMGVLGGAFRKMGFREEFLEELQGIHDERVAVKFRPTPGMLRLVPNMIRFYLRLQKMYREVDAELEAYHRASLQLEQAIAAAEAYEDLTALIENVKTHNQRGAVLNIALPLMIYAKQRRYLNFIKGIKEALPPSRYLAENARYEPDSFLQYEMALDSAAKRQMLLERFGHFSANTNDFSQATWEEQPQIIESLISAPEAPEHSDIRGKLELNSKLKRLKDRADLATLKKNKLSYHYAYSLQLFRRLFLKLGRCLANDGAIAAADDIFFLSVDDVVHYDGGDYRQQVADVRAEMERVKDFKLPAVIKGDEPPLLVDDAEVQERFSGYPASTGRVRGPAKLVRGLEDFSFVRPGDIVVVQNSEMGYAPLLRRAAAIVVETGAMLSHIAILARERQIPCVLSVPNATSIPDGTMLLVDAYKGEIVVVKHSAKLSARKKADAAR